MKKRWQNISNIPDKWRQKKEEKFIIERKGSDHMKGSYSHNKVTLLVEFEVLQIPKENFKNIIWSLSVV